MGSIKRLFVIVACLLCLLSGQYAYAQAGSNVKVGELENRIVALESYIQTLQSSLKKFSMDVVDDVSYRISASSGNVVRLNPQSKEVSKIVTNTGVFLVFIEKKEKIDNGYRVYLNVGNPNFVKYSGVTIVLRWGKSWDPSYANPSYTEWRKSLTGAEFFYSGYLMPGQWTEIIVDLAPLDYSEFRYLEGEMTVSSVELKKQAAY